ncbi:hypothetical protein [Kushneria aurantia]|uniref:Uncharacterized protein n=1 Tax=Kushneria aurantia TaxID=504092 RepID=A0ABV6FZA5_9GAMM|nr:hypothetical protein [Kushneria aurantia]
MIQRRRGGRIVALSSAAGQVSNRGQVNYAAIRGGVITALRPLALSTRRIAVNGRPY